MKKILFAMLCLLTTLISNAQEEVYICKTDNSVIAIPISEIEDIQFSSDNLNLLINKTDYTQESFLIVEIDSVTFIKPGQELNAVYVQYDGNSVTITNPYRGKGVDIVNEGCDVIVTSTVTDEEIKYILSGTTTDGMFKIYSNYKFNLVLNGVDITNNDGPAVNIQSGKKVTVTLSDGTSNSLTDGDTYTAYESEDMKSTIFSEGQLIFEGTGSLEVLGKNRHAICSDDYIRIDNGNISITGAAKDGIHANDYFVMNGGNLSIQSTGDAIECEKGYIKINDGTISLNAVGDGIKTSYKGTDTSIIPYIEIVGGTINATVTGDASKAIKSKGDVTVSGGELNLITTGNAYYDVDDADTSSSAAIKADGNALFSNDCVVTINSSGSGGKGINIDGTLTFDGGTINVTTTGDQYVYDRNNDTAAKAIKSDGNLTVNGGHIIISTSKTEAEGLESKATLTINGGTVEIEAYDDAINASNHIEINGGYVYAYSQTNDAIDSNGTLTITGGVIVASGAAAPEAGIDCDQSTFKITGGTIIGVGGSTSNPTTSVSTQRSVIYGAGSASNGQVIQVKSSAGDVIVFKVPRSYNSMTMLFSSPDLKSGTTYTISKGGSVTGGSNFHGLYTGATYSGGTTAYTFNPTSMVTNVGSTGGGPGGRP